jgi:hypothetical protein
LQLKLYKDDVERMEQHVEQERMEQHVEQEHMDHGTPGFHKHQLRDKQDRESDS